MFTLAQLLKAAGTLGYSGSKTDEQAVRSFLLGKINDDDTFTINGKRTAIDFKGGAKLTRSALENDGGGVATATLDEDEPTTRQTPPDIGADLKKLVSASIEAEIRKMGVAASNRPQLQGDGGGPEGESSKGPDIKVRSMAEVVFEIHKEQCRGIGNRPIFETFDAARAFQAYLTQQIAPHADKVPTEKRSEVINGAKWSSDFMVKRGFCKSEEIDKRTYATSPVGSGGAYLGMSFAPDIIKNVNFWGAALAYPRLITMPDAEAVIFKTSGDLTVNYPDENSASTSQKATPSNLGLRAKTGVMATKASMQVLQDARIDLAMQIADDFTRSLARHLERSLFIGDGTATYGGMIGLITRLTTLGYGTAAGLVVGGGTMSAHTDANVSSAIGVLPDWAKAGARIYCTPLAQDIVFNRLARTAGGATVAELANGQRVPAYQGIPITTTNAMTATADAGGNQVDAIIGDLSRAVVRGSRLTTQIEVDTSVGFLDYACWWRCVDRHDLVVHEYGTSSAVGGYVGLYQN